jgi:hypothetical protein
LGSLEQHAEELRHENAILCSGTLPSSYHNRVLQVMYRYLSEAEHGWNYFCQQLDVTHEMLGKRTHTIIHLEQQDLKLEERAAMIIAPKQ